MCYILRYVEHINVEKNFLGCVLSLVLDFRNKHLMQSVYNVDIHEKVQEEQFNTNSRISPWIA